MSEAKATQPTCLPSLSPAAKHATEASSGTRTTCSRTRGIAVSARSLALFLSPWPEPGFRTPSLAHRALQESGNQRHVQLA